MAISDIEPGTILVQSTEIHDTNTTLKCVVPIERSNMTDLIPIGMDTSVMLKIVTDSMYKNKLILIQEIPVNGKDAIISRRDKMLPGDKPFIPEIEIFIDLYDKKIIISDNGTGMSLDVIKNVYSIFGCSTKRDDKNVAGMFGVGAKTPFAMCDSYMIRTTSIDAKTRIEAIIEKRGIKILYEVPVNFDNPASPDDLPGTTVTAPLPPKFNESYYSLKHKIQRIVKFWNCPVSISHRDSSGDRFPYKDYLSLNNKDLSKVNLAEYPEDKLIIHTPEFSLYQTFEENMHESNIYVYDVPYANSSISTTHFFGNSVNIIVHDPNIVTLTATREGFDEDEKYKLILASARKLYIDYLLKDLDNYRTAPDKFPLKKPYVNKSTYEKLADEKVINKNDYPFFNLIHDDHKKVIYRELFADDENKTLLNVITQCEHMFITQMSAKKIRTVNLPVKSLIISEPDICNKFCLFCPEYDPRESGYYCDDKKRHLPILYNNIPFISKVKAPRGSPQVVRNRSKSFRGEFFDSSKGKIIEYASSKYYTYTSNINLEVPGNSFNNLMLVKPKVLKTLREMGCTIFDTNEDIIKHVMESIFVRDIENDVEIASSHLKDYDLIIHGVYSEQLKTLNFLKRIFPDRYKNSIMINFLPDSVIKFLPGKNIIDSSNEIDTHRTSDMSIKLEVTATLADILRSESSRLLKDCKIMSIDNK